MLATKISSKGQMLVPKEIREKLKIKPGTFFNVHLEKNNIILTPMETSPLNKLYRRFADEQVLGFQFLYNFINGSAPFYDVPPLGGETIMRGYFTGRYMSLRNAGNRIDW